MTKVKIAYTIDLEDIPEEVSGMLQKSYWSMKSATDKLDQPVTKNNVAGVIEMIDNVRRSMAEIDLRLEDLYSILYGYHQTMNQDPSKFNTKEISDKLEELDSSLENLKQKNESNQ